MSTRSHPDGLACVPVSSEPDYHCPRCGQLSGLSFGPTQAFCLNDKDCLVISWNPSVPVQDFEVVVIDFP